MENLRESEAIQTLWQVRVVFSVYDTKAKTWKRRSETQHYASQDGAIKLVNVMTVSPYYKLSSVRIKPVTVYNGNFSDFAK